MRSKVFIAESKIDKFRKIVLIGVAIYGKSYKYCLAQIYRNVSDLTYADPMCMA
jgi:hypothetical protein